jgi:hypothetical protein
MQELPRLPEAGNGTGDKHEYDFEQASHILEAMDFLRREAVNTRIPEIIEMIDASFRLLLTSYYCILRYEMRGLPAASEETD